MALKLTHTAAETLNDILLNALQQNGLEKSEILESQIFDWFDKLPSLYAGKQDGNMLYDSSNEPYSFVFKMQESDVVILAVIHSTRLPQSLKV